MTQNNSDRPLLFNRIFIVYNKDSGCDEDDFHDKFGDCGDIQKVQIQRDRDTKRDKGFCYIHYKKSSEACLAVEKHDETSMKGSPRPVRVYISISKNDNLEIDVDEKDMLQRLFIRHPRNFKHEELEEEFSKFGQITWLYTVKDKVTKENRGCSFIKFSKQSETAKALEECDPKFKPRWADVRSLNFSESKRQKNGESDTGRLGGRNGSLMGAGDIMARNQENFRMGGNNMMGMNFTSMDSLADSTGGSNVMDFVTPRQLVNNTRLEALVPSTMNSNQVYNVFNIAPGLKTCSLDQTTGIVKIEYSSVETASYAKERIDGLDINGQVIAIRVPRPSGLQATASQIQQTLAKMGGVANPQISELMMSLQQVTEALQNQNVEPDSENVVERVNWCSVPLPGRKRLTPKAPLACKMFVVTVPDRVPSEMLENLMCRFGNLINCSYVPRTRYAFANFSNRDSAQNALDALSGKQLFIDDREFTIKISYSKESGGGPDVDRAKENAIKRQRTD